MASYLVLPARLMQQACIENAPVAFGVKDIVAPFTENPSQMTLVPSELKVTDVPAGAVFPVQIHVTGASRVSSLSASAV